MLVLAGLVYVVEFLEWLSGEFDRQVAFAHTGFNLVLAMLGLPLVGLINRIVEVLIPEPPVIDKPKFGPRHINTGTDR